LVRRKRRHDQVKEGVLAGSLLAGVLKKRGMTGELRAHRLVAHWEKIVGAKVAARSVPDGLHRGVLWVRVDSAAWMHELSFLRQDIANNANALCGDPPLVNEVRLHLGGRTHADDGDVLASIVAIRRPEVRERPLPPPATGEQLKAIEAEVARVADDELRAILLDTRRRLRL
jgi:predicted nucleic acid-binding Zn ribbon protein